MAPQTKPIRVLTIGPAAQGFAERALHFETDIAIVGAVRGWRIALERLPELQPEVLLLEAGPDQHDTITALEAFADRDPTTGVVVLDACSSLASLRRAMLAGAAGYLALPPDAAELVLMVRRAAKAVVGQPGRSERCSTVSVVWSPKGGAGCSTVAINVAIALGRDAACIVVDGDPHGDIEVLLDLVPGPTLGDLLSGELDAASINDAALPHPSGIRVLLAPPQALGGASIDPQRLPAVIDALRGSFRHIVVDAGTALDDRVFALLDHADRVVVVVTPEPAAFRRLTNFTELTAALGMEAKLVLVLNRFQREHAADLDGVQRALGRVFDHRIGDATREMAIAATDGVPLLLAWPDHAVARDIAALAELLQGVDDHRHRMFILS